MTAAPDFLPAVSIDALKAVIAGLLLVVAVGLGIATLLRASPPQRRADDPAVDPHAEPYGECPGFSRDQLARFDVERLQRAERGGV
ncbi:hypothetical protein [Rhodopseudomonas telluris]|uniref:Uncharacterized protein n=1 Tax=Rhodopseudomonas telluris TaxID=644215 RepID=A0ABV6EZI3_9BRAD